MDLLENAIQPYAWGSRTAIAALRGAPVPSPGPEAELWMGAHPGAPSHLVRGGERLSLAEAIARAPEAELGRRALAEHGAQLPFLLKVLAAEKPLSLQAHPDARQAREGFDREEAAGIPRDAPQRNYRDPWPKPELLCALGPFEALCGFRPAAEALAILEALRTPELLPAVERLRGRPGAEGLREAFTWLVTQPAAGRESLAQAATAGAARAAATGGPWADALAWAARLGAAHPGDPGVAVVLLLHLVHLEAGQALYLPPGSMHAYLHGVGVEIMASSDNVLRGGLTPKHVDVPELLRVLRFDEEPAPLVRAREASRGERVYPTPARHFELSRLELSPLPFEAPVRGPEILLCTEGTAEAQRAGERLALPRGGSAFIPAATGRYALRGPAVVFRAALPREAP